MDASFTNIVQEQVDDLWREKIQSADFECNNSLSGRDIRNYLNDRRSLNTISFVIRRYLIKKAKAMLDDISKKIGVSYADLSSGLNESWPEDFIKVLSKELFSLSKRKGIVLSSATWYRYLSGEARRLNTDTLFKIAFSLQMNVEDTLELMLASGQDTYCMRNPRHLIFYYCQKKPNAYSWLHAADLIERFFSTGAETVTAGEGNEGMTFVMQDFVTDLINSHLPEAEADDQLLAFMQEHKKEFSSLSLTRRKDLLAMARYLAQVYPSYYMKGEARPVSSDTEGNVKLDELVRAMFSEGGWLETTVSLRERSRVGKNKRTASSLKRRGILTGEKNEDARKKDEPFLNQIQFFVDHFSRHLAAVDRVYTSPDNTQNVDRRDVILFTYFFLRQYPAMLDFEEEYGVQLDHLTALAQGDTPLDRCMDELMGMLYDAVYEGDADMDYISMFNLLLKHFGMHPLYLPCPYDRFMYMSLFAEDPSAFTEAVLWNVGPEEETPEEEKQAEALARSLKTKRPRLLRKDNSEVIYITSPHFTLGRYTRPKEGTNRDKLPDYGFETGKTSISRRHCLICFDGDVFMLADISKVSEKTNANRTCLNGTPLQPNPGYVTGDIPKHLTVLKDGDIISIYEETFTFRTE